MPSILLFPLLPFTFEVGLIIYWIAVTGESVVPVSAHQQPFFAQLQQYGGSPVAAAMLCSLLSRRTTSPSPPFHSLMSKLRATFSSYCST